MNRYCDRCLETLSGSAAFHNSGSCLTVTDEEIEFRAGKLLDFHCYLVRYGAVWFVENDDPDNWQDRKVADWPQPGRESDSELLRLLQEHRFPTSDLLMCKDCHDNPIEFLGESCYDCNVERAAWDQAERKSANAL